MMNSVAGSATSSAASGSCTFHQSCLWHWSPAVKRDLESLLMEAWASVVMQQICRGGVTSVLVVPSLSCVVQTSHRLLEGHAHEGTERLVPRSGTPGGRAAPGRPV